ncbi:hypothetical protein HUT16_04970 [Kitasatospora sp. NA04385]|uniref:hypothetical protein n=1 Tax=Kitasatospora sp. NA04385 TaxID=2742135 RepID=UPI0015920C51|nr:hypothetical protein [Kitasatospora sp. NA04385]QKW18503.1 hypothetical protein HUT16_04970 [Kitasatospora sp. NA04385]
MDPISLALLAALAGGAGGEAGKQCWNGLTALVRRPFRHAAADTVSSGEAELVALEQDPQNAELAGRLNTVLAVRAVLEPEFGPELEQWHGRARAALGGDTIHNEISGGTFNSVLTIQGKITGGTHTHYHGTPPQG